MKKAPLVSIIPGILLSMSADAAQNIIIDDSNFNQYLFQKEKSLNLLNSPGQFVLDKSITLSNGVVKKKYIQYYKNVPVFGSTITSTDDAGTQNNWWGTMLADIKSDLTDTNPTYSEAEALSKAKKLAHISENTAIQNEKVTLYVMQNQKTNVAELIYLVSFYIAEDEPQRPYFILNARNGDLIDKWDGLTTRDGYGPGGNNKTGQYYYGKDYSPLVIDNNCQMVTNNVLTYNLNHQQSGGTLFKFASCPATDPAVNTYQQINGGFSPLNDAHYFGNVVYDMYEKWYNFEPLGKSVKLNVKVHFGNNYENAFWDGQNMNFGDGGSTLYPMTALDVMGHEVSHGVTEKTSGLVYSKQSGGMNEAFSDMAGETAEYYMASQVGKTNDWLCGATIMKTGEAMRYFANPSKDGRSIENASDYNDSLNVHFTSGVYNKAFYTLATKTNWGIRKAFEVFLNANRVYWKANSTFQSGACGVAKAAHDLNYDVSDVIASFKIVGVDANCTLPDPNPGPTPNPGQDTEIKNGQTISNIQLTAGQERRFFINVPGLSSYPYNYKYLYITLGDGKNTAQDLAELYVRYQSPTLAAHAQPKLVKKDEMFFLQYPLAGRYYILVKGLVDTNLNLQAVYGN